MELEAALLTAAAVLHVGVEAVADRKQYNYQAFVDTSNQIKLFVCADTILHCPAYFEGVVKFLAFCTAAFRGVCLCPAPPETGEQIKHIKNCCFFLHN